MYSSILPLTPFFTLPFRFHYFLAPNFLSFSLPPFLLPILPLPPLSATCLVFLHCLFFLSPLFFTLLPTIGPQRTTRPLWGLSHLEGPLNHPLLLLQGKHLSDHKDFSDSWEPALSSHNKCEHPGWRDGLYETWSCEQLSTWSLTLPGRGGGDG